MADVKITELNEATTVTDDDLVVVVDSPASSAETKKATVSNLLAGRLKKDEYFHPFLLGGM